MIKSRVKRVAVGIAAIVIVAASAGAVPASAASPWWGLTSGSWPTSLHPGVGADEAQELAVSADGGEVVVIDETGGFAYRFFPWNATHEQVQTGLQELYGAGNVEVSGGPGDETASTPYTIVFTGALADQRVPPINARASAFYLTCGEEPATHPLCRHEASVTEKTVGRPDGKLIVTAENPSSVPADGSVTPIVLEDTLPDHVDAVSAEAVAGQISEVETRPVKCAIPAARRVRCVYEGVLQPYEEIEMRVSVRLAGASSGEINTVTTAGGGAPVASLSRPLSVGAGNGFGVAGYQMLAEEADGSASHQAGAHPFQLTTVATLDTREAAPVTFDQQPAGMPKDLTFNLPPGLIGNPTPLPQCTDIQFSTIHPATESDDCEARTAVGVAVITFNATGVGVTTVRTPVFNLVPLAGEPARFGFIIAEKPTFLDTSVRTGSDYGVTVTVSNITEIAGLLSSKVTFWGVPGDPAHDNQRGWQCLQQGATGCSADVTTPPPLLSMPTSCTGPMLTTLQADSWEEPHPPHPAETPLLAEYEMGGMDGCNRLQFEPEIRVTPDGTQASKPTGLNVDVHVPQTSVLNREELAEAAVKDITVALPAGVAINPAGGGGLEACSESLAGFTGFAEPGHGALFTSTLPEPLRPGLNFCSNASKIGEVTIKSPLLPATQPIKGFVYLASQNENPFGSLIALYIVAKEPVSGTVVKLTGETRLCQSAGETIDGMACQAAGQVVATFLNNPQLAFEDAELHFFGEERAPLSSPARCGAYTTNAAFVPWSSEPGETPHDSTSTFSITSGPNGSACPGQTLPFSPSLTGGTTNINAGSFSPLTTTISRTDGQQDINQVILHMPPGVSGLLPGVKLCAEQQANQGFCGPESLIGEDTVSAGVGNDPITVPGAKIYLTGPYHGAPFGLSIVNPAKAGPFDLDHDTSNPAHMPACDCIVDRAKIEVNPITAELTVTTNAPGEPYSIPQSIDGIPLRLQHINVTIDRPNFTFNPTNCEKLAITGTIVGYEEGSAPVHVPFQVANCKDLAFKPSFKVSTSGKTSRKNGASLRVRLTYPKAPFGTQANIKSVHVELPRALPSRLSTLNHACPDSVFNQNPASCPAQSRVGHARATTPVLPVPLEGPAYFVSHGGQKFPELIVVLQGYGVTIDLEGETFISKAGVTSSTFKSVPDVPVGTFELTLPQGQFSALAANRNLCTTSLAMPTVFTAQNGAVVRQSTKIAVTGCKPAIRVVDHSVKGSHASIRVSVPSAGTLVATGTAGVKRSVRHVAKAGTVTIGIALSARDLRVLAKNPHQRIDANVQLRFTPKHGAPLTAHVRLLMG